MTRRFSKSGEENIEIDESSVLEFFEKRAEKVDTLGPSQAVIYQDKNPKLAESRDAAEKALLQPKIKLDSQAIVLDAGCGTGRWAEVLIPACASYYGIDVSPGLIDVAKKQFEDRQNAHFSVCSLDNISLQNIGAKSPFTHIVSFGVFIYLNDAAVLSALERISQVAAPQARIVMREPIAITNRLTLKEHFSEDMDQYYSAIYRTEDELLAMLNSTVGAAGFTLVESGDVYDSGLNNRVETKQRWYVWERSAI